jgi:hypothetical protein
MTTQARLSRHVRNDFAFLKIAPEQSRCEKPASLTGKGLESAPKKYIYFFSHLDELTLFYVQEIKEN